MATNNEVLRFGSYSAIRSLDPALTFPSGLTGGAELAAIYNLLVRFDPATGRVEPMLARSISVGADGMEWRIELCPESRFNDGSPVTAAAVRASIDRYNVLGGQNSQLWHSRVQDIVTVGAGTVIFRLRRPWRDFPAMLALGHGMIVGPGSDQPDGFTANGAGVFTVREFQPATLLSLEGGPTASVAGIDFATMGSEAHRHEAFMRGDLDVAVFRDPATAKLPGVRETLSLGAVVLINNRAGHPGSDVRVRRAIALALDRIELGYREDSVDAHAAATQWGPDYDPIAAVATLRAVLNEGYDGRIGLWSLPAPAGGSRTEVIGDMLRKVGFDVTVGYLDSVADVVRRVRVEHDFDLAVSGVSLFEHAPSIRLHTALHSESDTNTLGYADSHMDELLERMCAADSLEAATTAQSMIQELVEARAPFAALGSQTTLVAIANRVRGIQTSVDSVALLDQANMLNETH